MKQEKRVRDSYTEQVHIVRSDSLNGFGSLFGGRLLEWIDIVAGVVGRRHFGGNVTTVAIDSLVFSGPAHLNDIIQMIGKITYVGTTSMEICIKTFVESADGTREQINTAYFVMVAIGADGKPARVPGLIIETDEERIEWEAGEKRNLLRKTRRKENY